MRRTRAISIAIGVTLAVLGLAVQTSSAQRSSAGDVLERDRRADGGIELRYRSSGVEQGAVVWLPPGRRSGDVVAWAHPTTGLADDCAPSAIEFDPIGLAALLDAGHVVVAPDYEGIGADGEHPYLVGASAGRSVLDAIRAARTVADVHGRSAVYGWSQGGHAALFAAELAPSYAPDVELVGVAAIAPVTDVERLVTGRTAFSAHPGFVAMVAAGFATAYPELDPADLVPDPDAVDVARGNCAMEVGSLLEDAPVRVPGEDWKRRLEQNDPTRAGIDVPVLLLHGGDDDLIAPGETAAAYGRLCRRGTTVRLEQVAGANHISIMFEHQADVVDWLDRRLEGNDLTGCAHRRS